MNKRGFFLFFVPFCLALLAFTHFLLSILTPFHLSPFSYPRSSLLHFPFYLFLDLFLVLNRDRVNAEIVHFYAEKIQKMHFQNFNASWDAGRLFVLDHFILNKTKRSEVEISRPQSEVEISWPPYWNEQRRRLGTILKHPGVLHAYPPF